MDGKSIFLDYLNKNFADKSLAEKFEKLTALYFEINSVINISAIRDENDIYIKHYLDSLQPHSHFAGECCDVGCGGGFPCLPLALATDLVFVGIDGVGKKLSLINRCAKELSLANITAVHSRSEDFARQKKFFDTVCARAVSDVDTAIKHCSPLAKKGGKIILYKTQNDETAKLQTLNKYKVKLLSVDDYTLYKTDIHRRLFIYEKL